MDDIINIKWHGRGGQGAITAAKIVAKAAFHEGFKGVTMAPSFGTERRGAPVSTSLKLARTKIYDLSPIKLPEIVVVLGHALLDEVDVTQGLAPGGLIVLNTPKQPEDYGFKNVRLACADVTELGAQAGLRKGIVNSGIIGSFVKASGLITDTDYLLELIRDEFKAVKPDANARAAELAFNATTLKVLP